jgi:hypothetical protein
MVIRELRENVNSNLFSLKFNRYETPIFFHSKGVAKKTNKKKHRFCLYLKNINQILVENILVEL